MTTIEWGNLVESLRILLEIGKHKPDRFESCGKLESDFTNLKTAVRLHSLTADRGLLVPTRKQDKLTSTGLGAFTDKKKLVFQNSKTSLSFY